MTLSSDTIVTPDEAIDWKAATQVADALGRRTLLLVSERDPEAVIDWALKMAQASSTSSYMATRAASYLELAVLVGHAVLEPERTEKDDERLKWLVAKVAEIKELGSRVAEIESQLKAVKTATDKITRAAEAAADESNGKAGA